MKTEDKQITLREAIAIVIGKRAAGIPITGAREELAEDFITDWVEIFGIDSL